MANAQVVAPGHGVVDRRGDIPAHTPRTEVALRPARGEGKPGAYTPAAAFGPDLAVTAGGTFILD